MKQCCYYLPSVVEKPPDRKELFIILYELFLFLISSVTLLLSVLMMNHDMCWIMWTAWFYSCRCRNVMHTNRNCMWVVRNYINKFRSWIISCKIYCQGHPQITASVGVSWFYPIQSTHPRGGGRENKGGGHLTTLPLGLWGNSTPFWYVSHFCSFKIEKIMRIFLKSNIG